MWSAAPSHDVCLCRRSKSCFSTDRDTYLHQDAVPAGLMTSKPPAARLIPLGAEQKGGQGRAGGSGGSGTHPACVSFLTKGPLLVQHSPDFPIPDLYPKILNLKHLGKQKAPYKGFHGNSYFKPVLKSMHLKSALGSSPP